MHIIKHMNSMRIVKCEARAIVQRPGLPVYLQVPLKRGVFIRRWGVKGIGLPAFKEHDFSAEGSDSIHS